MEFPVADDLRFDPADGLFKDGLLQLAFPDNDNEPSFRFKLPPYLLVSFLISCNLFLPEISVCLWNSVVFAPFVSVPEATVDEDDCAVLGQDEICLFAMGYAGEKK